MIRVAMLLVNKKNYPELQQKKVTCARDYHLQQEGTGPLRDRFGFLVPRGGQYRRAWRVDYGFQQCLDGHERRRLDGMVTLQVWQAQCTRMISKLWELMWGGVPPSRRRSVWTHLCGARLERRTAFATYFDDCQDRFAGSVTQHISGDVGATPSQMKSLERPAIDWENSPVVVPADATPRTPKLVASTDKTADVGVKPGGADDAPPMTPRPTDSAMLDAIPLTQKRADIRRVLEAYCAHTDGQPRDLEAFHAMAAVVAQLLAHIDDEEDAFWVLVKLAQSGIFAGAADPRTKSDLQACAALLSELAPELAAHCAALGLPLAAEDGVGNGQDKQTPLYRFLYRRLLVPYH